MTQTQTPTERLRAEAAYRVFERFALQDQRSYYQSQVKRNRLAASQVNRIRAFFALLTGLSSAFAGLIVSLNLDCPSSGMLAGLNTSNTAIVEVTPEANAGSPIVVTPVAVQPDDPGCGASTLLVPLLLLIAVLAPALGGAFGTLADLFQWDRLVNIYEGALENLEVADARSPIPEMNLTQYNANLRAYSEGTLAVMRDETAQWGQLIRTPEALQRFVARELAKVGNDASGLTKESREFIRGEIERVRAAAEETNQNLEKLREIFDPAKDTKPPAV